MSTFAYSQILVGLALLFDLLSFQFKSRRAILGCLVISASLVASHFLVLDNLSAGWLTFLAVLRFSTAYFSRSQLWICVFAVLACLVTWQTYQ